MAAGWLAGGSDSGWRLGWRACCLLLVYINCLSPIFHYNFSMLTKTPLTQCLASARSSHSKKRTSHPNQRWIIRLASSCVQTKDQNRPQQTPSRRHIDDESSQKVIGRCTSSVAAAGLALAPIDYQPLRPSRHPRCLLRPLPSLCPSLSLSHSSLAYSSFTL